MRGELDDQSLGQRLDATIVLVVVGLRVLAADGDDSALNGRGGSIDPAILAIGLGAVFLHLQAELNFYKLFNEEIEGFTLAEVGKRQKAAFAAAKVPLP